MGGPGPHTGYEEGCGSVGKAAVAAASWLLRGARTKEKMRALGALCELGLRRTSSFLAFQKPEIALLVNVNTYMKKC